MERVYHRPHRLITGFSVLGLTISALMVWNVYGGLPATADLPSLQRVTVSPTLISYDDQITITIAGLPGEYTLHAGSVNLAGIRVPLPGYFENPGAPPKSDEFGRLTITTLVPPGVPIGPQIVTVDSSPIFTASTIVNFVGASLSVSQSKIVANETIEIRGSGFTPFVVNSDSEPHPTRQISGRGASVVTLGEERLAHPNVDYPINLDKYGGLSTTITIPVNADFSNFLSKWKVIVSGEDHQVTPQDIAVDRSGTIYISDTEGNRLLKFDSSGNFLTQWRSDGCDGGELDSPMGIAVSAEGYIYVADTGNHRVLTLDNEGNYISKWETQLDEDGNLFAPEYIAISKSGNLYVSESDGGLHRITKLGVNGDIIWKRSTAGSSKLAIDDAENIYVPNLKFHLIEKLDADGNLLLQWGSYGNGQGEFINPAGIAVGPRGYVYVFEKNGWRIQKFNSSGDFLKEWGTHGDGDAQFDTPTGIALDDFGGLYVADSGNNRIQRFDSSMERGNIELRVTDSSGRTGSTYLAVQHPNVTINPPTGLPGETLLIQGQGFPASNSTTGIKNSLRVGYRLSNHQTPLNQTGSPIQELEVPVDLSGNFHTRLQVPSNADKPSSNSVVIKPIHGEEISIIHDVPAFAVTSDPTQALPNQEIEVTLRGLPVGHTVQMGQATLGGIPLAIPGFFGQPGLKPKADYQGRVTFSSTVPKGSLIGRQNLEYRVSDLHRAQSDIEVLAAELKISPASVSPGQMFSVLSDDLSPSSQGAPGPLNNHQITSEKSKIITIGGQGVGKPFVSYPINVDVKGRLFLTLGAPVNHKTLAGEPQEIRLADTGGRTGIGTLNIKTPTLKVLPPISQRGSRINVTGEGFIASNTHTGSLYRIDVFYADQRMSTNYIDESGNFEANFNVPHGTTIGSTNMVSARVRDVFQRAETPHFIRAANIVVKPSTVAPGSQISIIGKRYPANQRSLVSLSRSDNLNSRITFSRQLSSNVYTDVDGNFTVVYRLPEELPVGEYVISASVRDTSDTTGITVTTVLREGPPIFPTATPWPHPTTYFGALPTPHITSKPCPR